MSGWADVLTKHDLDGSFGALDHRLGRLEARLDRLETKLDDLASEIRAQTWKLMTLMAAFVGIFVAAVRV